MSIHEKYASAIAHGSLQQTSRTVAAPGDIVGAVGLAGKIEPLGAALLRLLSGDNGADREVVQVLATMARTKAIAERIPHTDPARCTDLARAVLAWFRYGRCEPCGGLGYEKMAGAPSLSDRECPACAGKGKIPFEREFSTLRLVLAYHLRDEIDYQLAIVGPLAMSKLASDLDL